MGVMQANGWRTVVVSPRDVWDFSWARAMDDAQTYLRRLNLTPEQADRGRLN
jgi:hypothetical protein